MMTDWPLAVSGRLGWREAVSSKYWSVEARRLTREQCGVGDGRNEGWRLYPDLGSSLDIAAGLVQA